MVSSISLTHLYDLTQRYIATVNQVLALRPADMTVGMHLCRGNFRSRWIAQRGYEPVVEVLFNNLNVDAFSWNTTRLAPGISHHSALWI